MYVCIKHQKNQAKVGLVQSLFHFYRNWLDIKDGIYK